MRQHHVILVAFLAIAAAVSPPGRAAEDAPIELKTLMGKWLEAKRLGDAKMIGYYLADDFLGVGPRGQAMDKRQFIAALSNKEIEVGEMKTEGQSVAFHGSFAVTSGVHRISGKLDGEDVSGDYRYVEGPQEGGQPMAGRRQHADTGEGAARRAPGDGDGDGAGTVNRVVETARGKNERSGP